MTREEHRRRAETLLASAWKRGTSDDYLIQTPERRKELIATAHVHALLALPDAPGVSGQTQEED